MIRRAYSVASSSLINEYMEFYISLVSNGALTPRIFNLGIGDKIYLSKRITGLFTLEDVPANKNIVMIATGTGLAPYMSMLATELICGGPRKIAVLHGAYHSWDLGYRSELMTVQHLCKNLAYFATIDQPQDEPIPWRGPVGFVQQMWNEGMIDQVWGFHPNPQNSHVFLCGNPAMINDMEAILVSEGFAENTHHQPGQIHIERY
jgi:ferredoxin--NADP+ reductase